MQLDALASEDQTQKMLVDWCEWSGYRVLVTSRRRKRCEFCGEFSRRPDGVTKGLSDLMIRDDRWPPLAWMAVEVKTATGRLKPEQEALRDAGAIVVCRGLDDLTEALAAFERGLRR